MNIFAETLDRYKNYHFYVVSRLGNHQEPYVSVAKNNERVAWLSLNTLEVNFYTSTPAEVIRDKKLLTKWLVDNLDAAKKCGVI